MPRINRRSRRRVPVSRGLTPNQEFELLFGLGLGGERAFDTLQAYEQAWWLHRAGLMALIARVAPFQRPSGFWEIEVKYFPNCAKNGYETDKKALLRLGLPLTDQEEAILKAEKAGEALESMKRPSFSLPISERNEA